jgi:Multicopper oxidase
VGSLAYLTLVFESHPVTIVAADAVPVEPLDVDQVDINLGQRCGLESPVGVLAGWLAVCVCVGVCVRARARARVCVCRCVGVGVGGCVCQ